MKRRVIIKNKNAVVTISSDREFEAELSACEDKTGHLTRSDVSVIRLIIKNKLELEFSHINNFIVFY